MMIGQPFISDIAKEHAELAKQRDGTIESGKDTKQFWYWLGYWDGQQSITDNLPRQVHQIYQTQIKQISEPCHCTSASHFAQCNEPAQHGGSHCTWCMKGMCKTSSVKKDGKK